MKYPILFFIVLLISNCTSKKEVKYTQTISFTVYENEINVGMNQMGNLLLILPLDSILKVNNSNIGHLNKMQLDEATLISNDTNLNKKLISEFRLDLAGDLPNNQPGKPFTLANCKEISEITQLKTSKTDISEMYSGRAIYLLPIGTFIKNHPKPFSLKLILKWKMTVGQIN
jgi:hypothetical protein